MEERQIINRKLLLEGIRDFSWEVKTKSGADVHELHFLKDSTGQNVVSHLVRDVSGVEIGGTVLAFESFTFEKDGIRFKPVWLRNRFNFGGRVMETDNFKTDDYKIFMPVDASFS